MWTNHSCGWVFVVKKHSLCNAMYEYNAKYHFIFLCHEILLCTQYFVFNVCNANTITLYRLLCSYCDDWWKVSIIFLHRCSYVELLWENIKSKWLPFYSWMSHQMSIIFICFFAFSTHPIWNGDSGRRWANRWHGKWKQWIAFLHVDYTCLRIIETIKYIP